MLLLDSPFIHTSQAGHRPALDAAAQPGSTLRLPAFLDKALPRRNTQALGPFDNGQRTASCYCNQTAAKKRRGSMPGASPLVARCRRTDHHVVRAWQGSTKAIAESQLKLVRFGDQVRPIAGDPTSEVRVLTSVTSRI